MSPGVQLRADAVTPDSDGAAPIPRIEAAKAGTYTANYTARGLAAAEPAGLLNRREQARTLTKLNMSWPVPVTC